MKKLLLAILLLNSSFVFAWGTEINPDNPAELLGKVRFCSEMVHSGYSSIDQRIVMCEVYVPKLFKEVKIKFVGNPYASWHNKEIWLDVTTNRWRWK